MNKATSKVRSVRSPHNTPLTVVLSLNRAHSIPDRPLVRVAASTTLATATLVAARRHCREVHVVVIHELCSMILNKAGVKVFCRTIEGKGCAYKEVVRCHLLVLVASKEGINHNVSFKAKSLELHRAQVSSYCSER